MARVTLSPLVAGINGRTADAVFAQWKGRQYVRQHVTPANPNTAGQQAVRASLSECVQIWHHLSNDLRAAFNAGAVQFNYSGYNSFTSRSRAILQAATGLKGPVRDPEAATPYLMIPPSMSAAVPADSALGFTWTDTAQGAGYYVGYFIYNTADNLFVEENLEGALVSAEALNITGLTNGKLYVGALMVCRSADSVLVHAASFFGTPAA